jgi:hypothetical protein
VTSKTDAARTDVVSDALDRLSAYAFVDGPGMATHGPMAAEALTVLGHPAEVAGWVERYKQRHEVIPAPPAVDRLDPADEASWRPALGDPSRLADWDELFTRRLADQPWSEVVAAWVPTLLAGYGGAFTHGLIRTAHAVRSLEAAPTPPPEPVLLGELAKGLAYWAGTYKALPGRPALQGRLSLAEAIAGLPRPTERWNPMEAGMFTRLHELPDFPAAVEALGPPPSIDHALSDLTAAYARMMVANPDVHPFGLVHALTPVVGARTLLPYVPAVSTAQVYAQLWQVNAAIAAGFVPEPDEAPPTPDSAPPDPADLVARAAEHQDPHVVKFTEAALAEHRRRPDPAYLHAVHHVLSTTPAW